MVKIIEAGSNNATCKHCKSVLEYEQSDVFLVNEAVGWAGETFDPQFYIECPHCSSDVPVNISSFLSAKLIANWKNKHNPTARDVR